MMAELEGGVFQVCANCARYGKIKRSSESYSSYSKPKFKPVEGPEIKIVENFAQLIRQARERSNLSQEDFARLINEKESIISKWETGSLRPGIDAAKRIGRALGTNFVKEEAVDNSKMEVKKRSDELTLGDFIKIKKRKPL